MEHEVLQEVPDCLKKLIKYIIRGFYSREHCLVIDILLRNPCMKEESLEELLKFEKKQLRTLLNSLKQDKFLKSRIRVETQIDGKTTTRHNYYYINYRAFVNVVKYKLHQMQKKIENEERNNTNRASFICSRCLKTFTDLEAGQLIDMSTGMMMCTYCGSEVDEDEAGLPKKPDSRALLARFNEQIHPIYELLKETENINLSLDLLEPEPVINLDRTGGGRDTSRTGWASAASRNQGFDLSQSVTINMMDNSPIDPSNAQQPETSQKALPQWLKESTVSGLPTSGSNPPPPPSSEKGAASTKTSRRKTGQQDDIMQALLVHESKAEKAKRAPPSSVPAVAAGGSDNESSDTSDSDDFGANPVASIIQHDDHPSVVDAEMSEDDDSEEDILITIGTLKVALHEVTPDLVAKMTPDEKKTYISLYKEAYATMYD